MPSCLFRSTTATDATTTTTSSSSAPRGWGSTTMAVPSTLLLRYFEIAQGKIRLLADGDLGDSEPPPSEPKSLSWHRSRIVEAQVSALEEAAIDSPVDREAVQAALRQIGLGDYSSVSFDDDDGCGSPVASSSVGLRSRSAGPVGGNTGGALKDESQERQLLLADAVDQTNELARLAFARSVVMHEWMLDSNSHPLAQSPVRELRGDDESLDEQSILDYCGLMMAAVRLPEFLGYLGNGTTTFLPARCLSEDWVVRSVEDRLLHIQKLCWKALGWEPTQAVDRLKHVLSEKSNNGEFITSNEQVTETLTKYTSLMTVAATNAAMSNVGGGEDTHNDDGTTRVVSVSYSEKIVNVPTPLDGDDTSRSLSAPTSNVIDDHKQSQQRRELDVAQKTAMLQQHIWSEFDTIHPSEQSKMVEKAKEAHVGFLSRMSNTPPGRERVLLMQSLGDDVQKLLVIYKLWSSQNNGL
ncbi:hypothetical protein ACHAWF_014454 [Thalassiosira exigua]